MTGPGGPFELVGIGAAGDPRREFRAGPRTLEELFRGLGRLGERAFVVTDTQRLSFAGFLQRAQAAASALRRRGVGPGRRIVLSLPNGLDWLTAFAGAALCGACTVLAPPGILEEQSERSGAGCVLAVRDPEQWRDWLSGPAEGGVSAARLYPDPDAEALIAFTSGTSGPPKPVRLDHRGVLSGLRNMMLGAALAGSRKLRAPGAGARPASPCVLVMAPLHHVGGYGQFLLMALLGGRLVIPSRWDAAMVVRAIEDEGVRSLQGLLPNMAKDLLDAPAGRLAGLAGINFYGAPPQPALAARLKAAFPQLEVGVGYGLTETNGSVAVAGEHDLRQRPGTAGRISPATVIRIVDEEGADAAPGAVGEIWLSGPMLAKGYGFAAGDVGGAFDAGWFRTGDFGRLDADRFLYLADREGESIQSGGRRLSCLDLEQAAHSSPAVRDSAAFGLPDPVLGQRPCLAVVLARGRGCEELQLWLEGMVDAPGLLLFPMDLIARTASGKVDRRALARQAACMLNPG